MAANQSTTLPADVDILGQLSAGIAFIETVNAALPQTAITPCPPQSESGVPMSALYVREGRKYTTAPSDVVLCHARDLLSQRFRAGTRVLDNPVLLETFLKEKLASCEHEVFALILLDGQERLIEFVEITRGTHNAAPVYLREVVKASLARNAAKVVLVHNHPSGDHRPSVADVELTHDVQRALAFVDIKVVDHFIVGKRMTSLLMSGVMGR